MARLTLAGFPPPPDLGELWCTYCAILAKGTLLAPQMEAIEAGLADDKRKSFCIGVDPGKAYDLINAAATWAPLAQLGGAIVPLCWLHLPAIDGNAPPPPESPPPARPGLITPGQGGKW
jgi:hypothetical protein